MTRKTSTSDLAAAMMVLANDIDSEDGVANAAILEAGRRLIEMDGQSNVLKGLLADCYSHLDRKVYFILSKQIDAALKGLA